MCAACPGLRVRGGGPDPWRPAAKGSKPGPAIGTSASRRLRRTGEFVGELSHVRRDGSVFSALVHHSLFRDEEGKPIGIIGTLRDITEAKRAEEEIKPLARFPAEAPNPVLRVSRNGTVLYANPASAALLRCFGAEAGGRLDLSRHEEIAEGLAREVRKAIDGSESGG